MTPIFQRLRLFSRQKNILGISHFSLHFEPTNHCSQTHHFIHSKVGDFMYLSNQKPKTLFKSFHSCATSYRFLCSQVDQSEDGVARWIQNILKFRSHKPVEEIEKALDRSGVVVTEPLLLNVLRRHRSDWKPALVFFNWALKAGFLPGPESHNEIIDILGKMRRFEEVRQLFDKMSEREDLVNESTYSILLNRLSAAHKVDEAIGVFDRRKEFGIEDESVAFQKLLMWLCRYKHVEVAETLVYSKPRELRSDIKAWNIILNGWCVRNNVREAKRFWKDIIVSGIRPDLTTYATFINALTKKGKLGSALKLFRSMMDDNRCKLDVTICNSMIDALCFKKRIPEALELLSTMKMRGCEPNAATYNSLIKYMCKIQRMGKVYEILDEMEAKNGISSPNNVTFNFLLKSVRTLEEVPGLLDRMERNGIGMTSDTYNLLLRLYMDWDCSERVRATWDEMEQNGLGPDQRSYTMMIHWLNDKGRTIDASRYFKEMTTKGMKAEPRTEILMNKLNINSKDREVDKTIEKKT